MVGFLCVLSIRWHVIKVSFYCFLIPYISGLGYDRESIDFFFLNLWMLLVLYISLKNLNIRDWTNWLHQLDERHNFYYCAIKMRIKLWFTTIAYYCYVIFRSFNFISFKEISRSRFPWSLSLKCLFGSLFKYF